MAITSNRRVLPYKSTTSRSDSRPSLQVVWTWKSQSKNGSYPGTLHPHVEVLAIGGPMPPHPRPKNPHPQAKEPAPSPRPLAARGKPDPPHPPHIHPA